MHNHRQEHVFCMDRLPVPAEQLPTGTIIVPPLAPSWHLVLYARVSRHDKQADLERNKLGDVLQVLDRHVDFAALAVKVDRRHHGRIGRAAVGRAFRPR